jgi:hypothetical protein
MPLVFVEPPLSQPVCTRREAFAKRGHAIADDTPIVRWAATPVDGVAHKHALPPMSSCTPEETNCGFVTSIRLAHRMRRQPEGSSSVLHQRSWFTVCSAAVVVNEASDVVFPGRIAPAVKA